MLTTIRGQKLRLDAIPEKLIYPATGRRPGILQTTVVPVTERTATIPVEWTLVAPEEGEKESRIP